MVVHIKMNDLRPGNHCKVRRRALLSWFVVNYGVRSPGGKSEHSLPVATAPVHTVNEKTFLVK